MERCRSHPVWEARTDFGSVGVIDNADQMPTTPRHRGGRCESGLSEIKRFGVGASLFERNENRVHISDALLISPECPVPAGASRPAGTPVPSAQLLEPHSSASPPVLLHCVHHGTVYTQIFSRIALWAGKFSKIFARCARRQIFIQILENPQLPQLYTHYPL